MIVALVIGAMVLTAVLTIYGRANRAAEAVLGQIESPALATEVLQRLAEDLDRVLSSDQGYSIQIKSALDNGFRRSELVIRRTMRNTKNEEKLFEEITWRAGYDYDGDSAGLVVYRGHEGIDAEDKLLDSKRDSLEDNYPLVPLCRGVTCFLVEIPKGEDEFVQTWTDAALPPGVRVSISFAQPHETVRGTMEVYEEEKIYRTIAIDKTRKIKFIVAAANAPRGGDSNADAKEQTSEETGSQTTSEQGSRITDRRASPRTNEPAPYKPVRPSTGATGRGRS
jgi:hypothetical protein